MPLFIVGHVRSPYLIVDITVIDYVDQMTRQLGKVTCPVLIVQGEDDPVVDLKSANRIYKDLGSPEKSLQLVPSQRHGILHEDISGTQQMILEFASSLG